MGVCKKCLRNTEGNAEFCKACMQAIADDEAFKESVKSLKNNATGVLTKQINKMDKNRKHCSKCGKPLVMITALMPDSDTYLCPDCVRAEEEQKKQRLRDEKQAAYDNRIEEMKKGKSFFVITRVAALSRMLEDSTQEIFDHNNSNSAKFKMSSGESITVEVDAPNTYTLTHKNTALKGTTPLNIDVSPGETYYIDYKQQYVSRGFLLAAALKTETISCKISKREIIVNGELKVYEAN